LGSALYSRGFVGVSASVAIFAFSGRRLANGSSTPANRLFRAIARLRPSPTLLTFACYALRPRPPLQPSLPRPPTTTPHRRRRFSTRPAIPPYASPTAYHTATTTTTTTNTTTTTTWPGKLPLLHFQAFTFSLPPAYTLPRSTREPTRIWLFLSKRPLHFFAFVYRLRWLSVGSSSHSSPYFQIMQLSHSSFSLLPT
jgi:hypothetical protein